MNTASRTSGGMHTAFSYCVQQVRTYEYHHYLCLLHLPPAVRKAAFTFRAFNIETARIMDLVPDQKFGLMRLLWWKEAIDKIFAKRPIEHPVAQALSSVVAECNVSKHWLKRSIDARINDANRDEDTFFKNMPNLENYAEETQSTILYMTLQASGIQSTAADHAASHVGKASGLLLLLKSLPHHANKHHKIPYIPASVLEKHGLLTKENGRSVIKFDFREASTSESLANAIFEVASVANAHLKKARDLAATFASSASPVLLPAVPAQVLLDTLERVEYNVFDSRIASGINGIPPLWYHLKLMWHAWRNKY